MIIFHGEDTRLTRVELKVLKLDQPKFKKNKQIGEHKIVCNSNVVIFCLVQLVSFLISTLCSTNAIKGS